MSQHSSRSANLASSSAGFSLTYLRMPFPIRICVVCGEEFELKPDKPGYANRCPFCSEAESELEPAPRRSTDYADRRAEHEVNAARRRAMRDLLYRKDS